MNLRADFDTYLSGDEISVRLRHRKGTDSQMARLENPGDEVWEIQIRKKAELRAIGRFASRDIFVAFFWKPHRELRTPEQWNRAKDRCQTEWANLFSSTSPHSGVTVDDYLTNGILI